MKVILPITFLLAIWVVLIMIFVTPEPPNSHGFAHEQYKFMDQGGDGPERHDHVLTLGWLFGSLIIGMFVSLLVLGLRKIERPAKRTWMFLLGGLVYEGIFLGMYLAYRDSLTRDEILFIGSFPAGTWWLIFGIWPIPLIFILLYVLFFNSWIISPTDLEKFNQLVAESRKQKDGVD